MSVGRDAVASYEARFSEDDMPTIKAKIAAITPQHRMARWAVRGSAMTLAKLSAEKMDPAEVVALLSQALEVATEFKRLNDELLQLRRLAKYEPVDIFADSDV